MPDTFLNSNGLVDGRIPAGSPCPFLTKCKPVEDLCPTLEKTKECDFSCAFARAWSISKES